MSDGAFSDRVTQLRNRWEADPSSRIFLQLAEEYRHQGRVKEALSVLDRGLKEHPGYLSALVAKGRCHLELGEPEQSRTVLERVFKQDATQMVANKLLVRAYLDTGEPERARERLDLYSLLNDSDPEIEELRRRLRTMEQPPQAETPASFPRSDSPFPEAAPPGPPRREAAPAPPAGGDVFDLDLPAPRRATADVFELDLPAPRARMAVPHDDPFADLLAPVPAAEAEAEPEGSIFPGLATRDSRRRYLSGLAGEGLFLLDQDVDVEAPAAVAPPVIAPPEAAAAYEPEPVVEEPGWAPEPEPEAPVFDLEEQTPWALEPAPLPAPLVTEPLVAEPLMAEPLMAEPLTAEPLMAEPLMTEPAATVTLGELYLKQGHLGEADRIFREVLSREPDSAAAREGLAALAARRAEKRPLEVRDLLAGYEPGHEGGEAETRARKAWVLNGYLRRLRGGHFDVS